MKNTKECLVWLDRAKDDIRWTEANLREEIYYGACFTAQQSTEKSLKAFLLFRQGRFDKIHDLVKLLRECMRFDKSFSAFEKETSTISSYYIQTRYPDMMEIDQFTKKEAEEALEIAEDTYNWGRLIFDLK